MTTAEAIEGMTDAGEFEILATRVLRITDEDCRLLEHIGVNAAGKTNPNPIDSFCRVPNTEPPRFVMAAFTTDKLESLKRKWLFDHASAPKAKKATAADDGDLVKAARRAETLRKDHPDATLVVHLCTNKQPDDQLMANVDKRGQDLGLEVRFLTRSRLRDILDVHPDGQWLRKEHLGIQAERLSLPLLRDLCARSLQQYEREFPITPPQVFINTSSERDLAAALDSRKSVCVVTGASGSGKSVASYQALRDHLANGGIGLWIPGETAARATSLEDAVDLALRSFHPTIEVGAGAVALRLVGPSQRLLVVVDDINRGGSPSESLRKLIAWGRPTTNDKENGSGQRYAIVAPVWDLFWAPLDEQFRTTGWLARVPVTQMSEAEACTCLVSSLGSHAQRLAEADQQQVVMTLGCDPILIAMYANLVKDQAKFHSQDLAHDVIGRFVAMAEAEGTASNGHFPVEFDQALTTLAAWLLAEKNLYPRWDHMQQWLSANEVQAIRELARLGKICRITGRGGENRIEFRHDRILEHFLVRALQPMLNDPESSADILSDPFYASFVGHALASSEPSRDLIAWIRENAPLVLVSTLRFLSSAADHVASRIVAAAKDWLNSAFKDRRTPSAVLFAACRLLETTDSPHLLDVTESLARHRLLARARLANGDANAGAIEFSEARWFAPEVNDRGLDAVLSRALHRHRQMLIADSAETLQRLDLTEADRRGALVLAGFIGDAALAVPVRIAWDLATDKEEILLPALWASMRCALADPTAQLDEMMAAWARLPDAGEAGGLSQRGLIVQELQFAVRRGIPEPVLRYLIAKAKADEALRWAIRYTLEHLNHPFVVKFLVKEAALIERRAKETGGFSPWVDTLGAQWDPTRESRGKRLPPEAVQEIRSCWDSETTDDQLRETAFRLWLRAVDDVDVLRSVSPDHPQFTDVLWRRAKLGDLSVVPLIKPILAANDRWFHVIANVWTKQFGDVLDEALLHLEKNTPTDYTGGATDSHYMLAKLLRDIPVGEAQPLLLKYWGHLRFSRLFVQVALYIGTPDCVALATKEIGVYPNNVDPFKHVGLFFGLSTVGLRDRLDLQHLMVFLPFVNRLDDLALSHMVDFCEQRGYLEWSVIHLKPEFDRRRAQLPKVMKEKQELIERLGRRHFPSDTDLLEELDWIEERGEHFQGHLYYWCEEFRRRQDDHTRWRGMLDEWLSRQPTVARFRVLTNAILEHGTREDTDLLSKHAISGDSDEVDRLRASARFGVMQRSLH